MEKMHNLAFDTNMPNTNYWFHEENKTHFKFMLYFYRIGNVVWEVEMLAIILF